MLLSNVLHVIWVEIMPLINFVSCLPKMEPFTKLHVQILLSKIALLKENIITLLKLFCFFLFSESVPNVFWEEVIFIATCLINTILSSHISCFSPFEKLYRYAPDYLFIQFFFMRILIVYHLQFLILYIHLLMFD